jgi:nitrate/nitrite transporter NarK
MNMMGNFGGMFGPMTVPYILKFSGGDWNVAFWVFGAVYWLGAFAWCFIDPVTPLTRDER